MPQFTITEAIAMFDRFVHQASDHVWAVANEQEPAREIAQLQAEALPLREYLAGRLVPELVRAKAKAAAKERRDSQLYILSWAGGGSERIRSLEALVNRLDIQSSSARVMLSKGRGCFSARRDNPITGERDIVNVIKLVPDEPTKPKRGRPRTRPWTEYEMERATQDGTILAPPAKTVPK